MTIFAYILVIAALGVFLVLAALKYPSVIRLPMFGLPVVLSIVFIFIWRTPLVLLVPGIVIPAVLLVMSLLPLTRVFLHNGGIFTASWFTMLAGIFTGMIVVPREADLVRADMLPFYLVCLAIALLAVNFSLFCARMSRKGAGLFMLASGLLSIGYGFYSLARLYGLRPDMLSFAALGQELDMAVFSVIVTVKLLGGAALLITGRKEGLYLQDESV